MPESSFYYARVVSLPNSKRKYRKSKIYYKKNGLHKNCPNDAGRYND